VAQSHLPDTLKDRRYYEPTVIGDERDIKQRVDQARRLRAGTADEPPPTGRNK